MLRRNDSLMSVIILIILLCISPECVQGVGNLSDCCFHDSSLPNLVFYLYIQYFINLNLCSYGCLLMPKAQKIKPQTILKTERCRGQRGTWSSVWLLLSRKSSRPPSHTQGNTYEMLLVWNLKTCSIPRFVSEKPPSHPTANFLLVHEILTFPDEFYTNFLPAIRAQSY